MFVPSVGSWRFLPFLLATAASATTVRDESIEAMTGRAQAIVVGQVRSVQAVVEGRGQIWTYVEFQIDQSLKGDAGGLVLLKQPGGIVGDRGQAVAGTAKFRPREACLVFLEKSVDDPRAYVVYALAAGKVSFELRHGQALAVRHLDGLGFAVPAGQERQVRPVDDGEVLGSRDAFLTRVRRAVKGGVK